MCGGYLIDTQEKSEGVVPLEVFFLEVHDIPQFFYFLSFGYPTKKFKKNSKIQTKVNHTYKFLNLIYLIFKYEIFR
tara:strand:- start:5051 stop:5278 length:228 start_codon:yes stop_codon:yes gene_type:complete